MKNKRKAILLVGALLCLNLNIFSQNIPLKMNKVSVKKAMTELKEKSGYSFVYIAGDVDTKKIVNIDAEQLQKVIEQILEGQNVSYEIKDKNIVIRKKEVEQSILNEKKEQDISGLVMDVMGEPIVGVNVMEKGTTNGTITDMDGKFLLKAPANATLIISFIGYKTLAVNLEGEKNVNITLKEDLEQLDEVVVVGYGTQKKSSLTASVATVPPKELSKQMGHSVAAALQGRAPGVEILQKGGEAGADIKILVRGAGTFGATEPLYVIDGAFSNNGLNSLNPSDIESIEILKDGSAAAIYGSRAANGVVLITTKHGQKGKAKVEISANYSLQTPSKYLDFLDANEHREYTKQIVANSTNQTQAPENIHPTNPNINTDWQDAYLRNAPMYNLNASISGGGEYSTFNTSLGYFDQQGIMEFSGFKKYNARVNGTFKKGRLTVSETLSAAFTNKEPQVRMVMGIPTVPMTDVEGRYVSAGKDYYVNEGKVTNPFASYSNTVRRNKTVNVTGSLNIGLNLYKGLDYKLLLGGDYISTNNISRSIAFDSNWDENGNADPDYSRTINSLSESRGQRFSYTIDNILTYKNMFAGHTIDVMVGTSWMREYYRTMGIGSGSTDLGGPNITIFNGKGDITSEEYNSALLSFFARLNYDYKERYLVSASIRSDKSSKFAKGNRVGYFPSVSVGWNIHEENFFNIEWISKMKIRASYGLSGNQDIALYQTWPLMKQQNVILTGTPQIGYIPDRMGNDELKWETTSQFDFGVEASFFKSRLNIEFDAYIKNTKDLLLDVEFPYTSGFKNGFMNVGKISNRGVELMIRSTNISTNDFTWSTEFNISHNRNEVVALGPDKDFEYTFRPGLGNHPYTWLKVGEPVGAFYGYIMDGIYRTREEIEAGCEPNASLGQKIYRDINHDGVITIEDQTTIGDPNPDFFGGLSNTFRYKNFTLNIFLQGTFGNDILSGGDFLYATVDPRFVNQYKRVKDFWSLDNPGAKFPKLYSNDEYQPSTYMVHDGSHLKIKSVSLYYNFPVKKWRRNKVISELQCYVTGTNLFTFTSYKGYDPEVNTGAEGGYNVYSANVLRGMDFTAYPPARTFTFGVKLTL